MRLRILVLLGAICATVACATEPLPPGNAAYEVGRGLEYTLGPGDKLKIVVFGDESLSGEFVVANNGAVAVPLAGDVIAGGLTPAAFQDAVRDRLGTSGMVRDPKVSINVLEYRPYYILGEVGAPGRYEYTVGLTITKAVATAGGFSYRADKKIAYVTREGKTSETTVVITAATWIGPGDTVRISERNF
ncbi:MAG: polysaccharide biosynthesis/export family protein [Hyphomonadaceae bacterium]|nr:polysaccharide biosynthesis/export family protein [Hyphomonadaceae bacterium]